jgi:ParB-like chromosome segregation protein Spo0J
MKTKLVDLNLVFDNPRRLTKKGDAELTDKQLSLELRESIKKHTLLSPLICRWAQDGEGYYPQLVGGERRYRALSYLRTKKELVNDPNNVRMND